MTEYIEREAALESVREKLMICDSLPDTIAKDASLFTLASMQDSLKSIPAADVRPVVRAEWYGEADGYADGELVYDMWSCPICGKRFEEWEEKPNWNFCPNCGADMRSKEDE